MDENKINLTLEQIAEHYSKSVSKLKRRIIICGGTGCIANGSMELRDALVEELKKVGEPVEVELGGEIEPKDAAEIVNVTILGGEIVDRLVYVDPATSQRCRHENEIPFYTRQSRVVLKDCVIEPDNVEEYIARGGYFGARKAVTECTSEQVCQTMIDAGLRGRGGGGFPTGLKWKFTLASPGPKKYVICNGDEGDPGAFMDRSVMEGNPHAVLEGMMIAGRAIGADEGVVYVRAEYPLAVKRMRAAIENAERYGLLGDNIFGSGFNFRIRVMEGAGALSAAKRRR